MASAKDTKDAYIQISGQKENEICNELVNILTQAEENPFENSDSFYLRLQGNKRNENNEMYRKRVKDLDAEVICLTLQNNKYITGLDLGYNLITDEGGVFLGNLLCEESCFLEYLILSYNDITAQGACAIAKGVQMNDRLRILKLNGNKIGVEGGMAIAGVLQVNNTLEQLNIDNTDQKAQSIIALTTVLKSSTTLKVLDIGHPILNSPQEDTTIHIARMLGVNSSIKYLHLKNHRIQNFGAERLVEHAISNTTLLVLDLSCNVISRDGAKHLATFLKANPPLQTLNLGYNRVEDDGAISLSEGLVSGNRSLLTLVLCSNSLTDKGLCALAKSLYINSTLQQLFIWGNTFGKPASQAFLEVTTSIADVPRLKPDDTDVCGYVVDGIPYLAKVDCAY